MKILLLIVVLVMSPMTLFSHGEETHQTEKPVQEENGQQKSEKHNNDDSKESATQQAKTNQQTAIEQINLSYQKQVKPIFEKKCFDCHGTITDFPWYYKVPGIKQLMDQDMAEAKKHLDMTNDFPFGGHGSPVSDLKSLRESIINGTMPILMYRLTHPDSKINQAEQKIVFGWIDEAVKNIKTQEKH
jgi:hypothetical protein